MNYSGQILSYLTGTREYSEIVLAPGAPPVERTTEGVRIVLNVILTTQDIKETLSSFRSHAAATGGGALGKAGVFCFGVPNQGRFRVSYLTQRGSTVGTISKIPVVVPELESIVADPVAVDTVQKLFSVYEGGIVLITGQNVNRNNTFAYSVLKRISQRNNRVIHIVERNLSFLLKHDKSLVLQTDLENDAANIEEAIRYACFLAPDVLYARDVRSKSELLGIMEAAEANSLVMLNFPAGDEKLVLSDLEGHLKESYGVFVGLVKKIIRVQSTEAGKLLVSFTDPA